MSYTQLKLKPAYRARLKALADVHARSMANMVEVLIDQAAGAAGFHDLDPHELEDGTPFCGTCGIGPSDPNWDRIHV